MPIPTETGPVLATTDQCPTSARVHPILASAAGKAARQLPFKSRDAEYHRLQARVRKSKIKIAAIF